jgi:hypothetical protein
MGIVEARHHYPTTVEHTAELAGQAPSTQRFDSLSIFTGSKRALLRRRLF